MFIARLLNEKVKSFKRAVRLKFFIELLQNRLAYVVMLFFSDNIYVVLCQCQSSKFPIYNVWISRAHSMTVGMSLEK